jgi:hypothetical protein
MRRIMLRKKRSGEHIGVLRHHLAERGLLVHLQLGATKSEGINELFVAEPPNICTLLPSYLLYD